MMAGSAAALVKLEIGGTNVFARAEGPVQHLVYSMNVAARESVAMILPLPVPVGAGESAVRFVDLHGYPTFFPDLNDCFPAEFIGAARGGSLSGPPKTLRTPLKVHRTGDFDASYVPGLSELDRLDPRFRFDPGVWDALPAYADWGFAVFQLNDLATRSIWPWSRNRHRTIHPMALSFPRRFSDRLFFPTVHVHDGSVHPEAAFDHRLFWQNEGNPLHGTDAYFKDHEWTMPGPPFDARRSRGLVDPNATVFRQSRTGRLPNVDQWVVGGQLVPGVSSATR